MTPLRLKALMQQLVTATGADGYSILAHDGHAVNRLRDLYGTHLIAVYPTISFSSNEPDFAQDLSTHYLFVVEKDDAGQTLENEIDQYEHLYAKTRTVVDFLTGNSDSQPCLKFPNLALSRLQIEPEYRAFGGWNGYSLSWTM